MHVSEVAQPKMKSGSVRFSLLWRWLLVVSPWRGSDVLSLARQCPHVFGLQAYPLLKSESDWGSSEWKWKWLRSTWVKVKVIEVHLSAVFPCEPLGCCHRWLPEVSRGGEEVVLRSVYICICILPKSPFLVSVQLQWQSEQEMKVQAARLISIIGPESKLPSPLVQWSWPVLLTSSSAGRRGQIQPGGRKGGDIDDKLDAVRLKVVIYLSGI